MGQVVTARTRPTRRRQRRFRGRRTQEQGEACVLLVRGLSGGGHAGRALWRTAPQFGSGDAVRRLSGQRQRFQKRHTLVEPALTGSSPRQGAGRAARGSRPRRICGSSGAALTHRFQRLFPVGRRPADDIDGQPPRVLLDDLVCGRLLGRPTMSSTYSSISRTMKPPAREASGRAPRRPATVRTRGSGQPHGQGPEAHSTWSDIS